MNTQAVVRRGTLTLAGIATVLFLLAAVLLDRVADMPWLTALVTLAGLATGILAVDRAWTRPVGQPSVDGSVAGPT